MTNSHVWEYGFVVKGRAFSSRARRKTKDRYKDKIRKSAQKVLPPTPTKEPVVLRLYYYHWGRHQIDHDNLSGVISDALKGLAYEDDSQVIDSQTILVNMNGSYWLADPPEELLDHLERPGEGVVIIISPVRAIRAPWLERR